jgi:hypothetical protein
MPRLDIYTPIHDAVRKLLFDTAMSLARADVRSDAELRGALDDATRALEFLHDHARTEDRHLHPLVAAREPDLAARAAEQHLLLDTGARDVHRLSLAIRVVTEGERPLAHGRLRARLNAFVAEHLAHMAFEETEMGDALWRAISDAEIRALHERIKAELLRERAGAWRALLSTALNPTDRALFLGAP